ncbi:MAG: hypothetical protein FJX55_09075 [Alphaproteobacteria bacterium]|nr:hypothetical protein [Alphaproteobacteria bacterium]
MQKGKIVENLEIEADQLEWLKRMAESYSLSDASKALRVVLDHAMEDADEDQIFMSIRCRRCG